MNRHKISPNGPEFSQLSYGTWRIMDDGASVQDINRRLARCLELGITTLDTAEIYGLYEVEALLGKAFALSPGMRDRFEIVTKAGIYIPCSYHPERKVGFYNASGQRLSKSLEKSLRLMGTDRVELLLVHRPDWLTSADDTASGLNLLQRTGKIRSSGVSNFSASQFDLLNSRMEQPLVTNQVEMSLLHMDALYDGVLDQCQKLRVRPMAWSPMAGGRLFDTSKPEGARLAKAAAELSEKYGGATLEQLAYAWILAHPSRPLPVIGTNKVERIESAVGALKITLEKEDWYALWVAAKGHNIP